MGFRYSKRYGGSKGWGLNVGSGGISSSYRGKYGSIGSRGFSIRTSIPGLTYRHSWGRSKKGSGLGALILLPILFFVFMTYISLVIMYNLARLAIWVVTGIAALLAHAYRQWKQRQALKAGTPLIDADNTGNEP